MSSSAQCCVSRNNVRPVVSLLSLTSRRRAVLFSLIIAVCLGVVGPPAAGQSPGAPDQGTVTYSLSFPAPEHRWLQVDAVFPLLAPGPLVLQMSNASPGRYAVHAFAKNVFDVEVFDGANRVLSVARPTVHQWVVSDHNGTVRLRYRVFGDRVDGTYLAVDTTHAHLNMPATLMWAHGLEDRQIRVDFAQPAGSMWTVTTQLFPTTDPLVFTAPNLQYVMDSPAEFGEVETRSFTVTDTAEPPSQPTFRVAVHHTGSPEGMVQYVTEIERVVRETLAVFGEFPSFETGTYTFIADYLPYAWADAMEHRNSAVLTSTGQLDRLGQRTVLLGAVAHEFFHVWNVERIRPHSLEPFDFTRPNVSGELWFAEGITNYYGPLVMHRSRLADLDTTLGRYAATLDTVMHSPGRQLRSAVEMSYLAPFVDAATSVDRTNWDNTFISYYTWGEAIGLGLDLTLRVRTGGRVSLDDYMRAMWRRFGKPGGSAPGLVDAPYTLEEARDVLGEVVGDRAFAEDFFARFVVGHEVMAYAELLAPAGMILRPRSPGEPWLGDISFESGLRVSQPTQYRSPLHVAGVDRDDVVRALDEQSVSSLEELARVLSGKRPGDVLAIEFMRRDQLVRSTVTVGENPHIELVTAESTGTLLTLQQRVFREQWLGSQQ